MVSVVVPNYNYKRFLKRRLSSLADQTYRDIEIIFIDDASTDGSVEYAEKILDQSCLPYTLITSSNNSGSVFSQWAKGLEYSMGKYVWFAEADDACAPGFLEALVPLLDGDSSIGLAYTASLVINEGDRIINPYFYLNTHSVIDPCKWGSDYINDGREEIREALSVMNTIPNASAVVMRTDALRGSGGITEGFRLSGDWMTYINVLKDYRIAYIHRPLNYNRFHTGRLTKQLDRSETYFLESLDVAEHVAGLVDVPERSRELYVRNFLNQIRISSGGFSLTQEILERLRRICTSGPVDRAVSDILNEIVLENSRFPHHLLRRIRAVTPKKIINKCLKRKI